MLPPQADAIQPAAQQEQPKQPKQSDKDKKTDKDKDKKEPPKSTPVLPPNLFSSNQNQNQPNQAPQVFHPHMLGDLPGTFARQFVPFTSTTTLTTTKTVVDVESGQVLKSSTTTTTTTTTTGNRIVLVPAAVLGAFKVAENESPMPRDRFFGTWNYFGNIHDPLNNAVPTSNTSLSTSSTFRTFNPSTESILDTTIATKANTVVTGTPRFTGNLNREVIGFEKTFLDGYASVEMRIPLLQQGGNISNFTFSNVGNITIVGKYAFYLDRNTGNVFSGGLAVTAPTGPGVDTIDGTLHSTYLQPWFGYIWGNDRFFFQAFHSVAAPTDPRDTTLLFNDASINFWLYRGTPSSLLRFLVPMAEVHVTDPLNHRDQNSAIFIPDFVVMTGGMHIGLPGRAVLT
ncbi:MAG TPA: hypothetical protein VFE62_08255, partial [Gemmataceae bacterium]|nr:hypothetical protein [Gemmataceae bacterium]